MFAQAQELPADLKHVPGNAIGFVHIQTADVWKSTWFKLYRDILPKAGAEALALLENRIVPSLSSIDRVTVVVMPPDPQRRGEPDFAVLLHLSQPLNVKRFVGDLQEVNEGNIRYYPFKDGAIQILDKNVVMMGSPGAPAALGQRVNVSASFKQALAVAASGKKAIVAALNPSIIPPQALANLPPMLQPFAKAKTLLVSTDLGQALQLDADLGFADAEQAKDAAQALEQARELGRAFLAKTRQEMKDKLAQNNGPVPLYEFEKVAEIAGPVVVLGFLKRAEEILDGIPVKQEQTHVRVTLAVPEELSGYATSAPVLIALLLPAVQKVREAASRTQDANNLRQLGIAMHNYHDNYRHLPAAAICDKNGKPLLSWRVAILPFLEQDNLYRQFKLDEPWDSAHNKQFIERMPTLYQLAGAPPSDSLTHYRVLVGPDGPTSALFRTYAEKVPFTKVTDGTSNTFMIVEADQAVPWTKPDELQYAPKSPLPRFSQFRQGFNASLCDGSVRFIANTVPEATLRALITRNGGEVVNPD